MQGSPHCLGDRLSPHVFLEGYGEICACRIAIFVCKDHAVLALNDADPRDHAAPGDVPPLLLFIGRPAVELFLADLVPGVEAQLEKIPPRIDQEPDELAHRLLPLLGEALRLCRPADIVGLLTVLDQERILLLPVCSDWPPAPAPAARPASTAVSTLQPSPIPSHPANPDPSHAFVKGIPILEPSARLGKTLALRYMRGKRICQTICLHINSSFSLEYR